MASASARPKGVRPPAGQRRGGHAQFARECFEVLTTQQPQNRCKLAFRRPAPPAVAPLFGSPSGRPAGSLRGSRSWFSLLAHTHLLVISDSFSSQCGVQENPRARELLVVHYQRAHLCLHELLVILSLGRLFVEMWR